MPSNECDFMVIAHGMAMEKFAFRIPSLAGRLSEGRPRIILTGGKRMGHLKESTETGPPERLNLLDRKQEKREAYPSVFCIDSQSGRRCGVKLAPMICEYRGLDPHKKVNGRKRQLLVDTGGRLWAAHVHAANDADGLAASVLVSDILWYGDRVEKFFGDGSYGGVFAKALAG